MNVRQLILLVVAVVCLVIAGVRIAKRVGGGTTGKSAGFHETWQCRGDGYQTNMTLAELDAQVAAGTIREDSALPVPTLFTCPKCGKITLECKRTYE